MAEQDDLEVTASFHDDLVALRRRLHQVPEIGLELPLTQEIVLDFLADLELEITTGTSVSSVVAVLRGTADDHTGRVVLLRGDMDALPVVETSGETFAATGDAMHACGHDLHTAGLVGAAHLLGCGGARGSSGARPGWGAGTAPGP